MEEVGNFFFCCLLQVDRLERLLPPQADRGQGDHSQSHVRRSRRGLDPRQHTLQGVQGTQTHLPHRQSLLRRGQKVHPTNLAELAADHGHARTRIICHADLQVWRDAFLESNAVMCNIKFSIPVCSVSICLARWMLGILDH